MKKTITKILFCFAVLCMAATMGHSQNGVQITIYPAPTLYSVMGGGSYCAGGTGVNVSISGSEVGVNYELQLNGASMNPLVILPGTGAPLSFGLQANGGNYSVLATNTTSGCSIAMSNTAVVQVNAIPNVIITPSGSTTFCGPGTVTLTANVVSGNSYQWQHNGVTIFGSTSNQYVANTTGMFTVVVTNTAGCINDASTMVTVNPLPSQFLVSASSSTFCQGGPGTTINQNGSSLGVNYQLMLNGSPTGSPVGGTGFPLQWANQAAAGTYSVQATDNATTCTSMMNGSAFVSMNPLPSAATAITGTTTVCQNTTASYFTNSIMNATSYMWSIPTGATIISGQGTNSVTIDFTGAISGTIDVYGQNACGSGQNVSLPVTVNQSPSLTVTATLTSVCVGNSTTLTANGTGTIFSWAGSNIITQSNTVTPSATTTYTVTATGGNGCTATGSIVVTVNPLPNVALNLTQSAYCTSVSSATLSGGVPTGGTWSGPAVFSSGGNIYPSAFGVGTTNVTYTYTDGNGCTNTATDGLTINPVPAVTFVNITNTINVNTPAFDLMNYVSPIFGTFTGPGVVGSMFNPSVAGVGVHMVTYTYVYPLTGCDASQIQYIPVGGVGIDEVNAAVSAVNIFPNPTSTNLNLTGINTKEIKSLKVINMLGEVVYSTPINAEQITINVSELSSGTYIISFMNTDGISIGRHFMKTE
ncbi:MAG: T9SS type A sorting domain-containing protein [candidate division SR1 bacterium]|nr:T9SS type A sorting domain-containing protein [candidate division SR1 bacterium]